MSEYFGNGVTATLDGDGLGQVKTMSIPEKSYDTEDFTGLGDSHEDLRLVPIQSAVEFDIVLSYDRSVTLQTDIEALVGVNTNVNLVVTFPWVANNTYTQAVVVKALGEVSIEPKGELTRSITLLSKADGAFTTV